MQKNTKKIDDKAMLTIGLVLILLVIAISILRTIDFSFLHGQKNNASDSSVTSALPTNKIDYATISTSDLQKHMLSNGKLILLDIRPFESYAQEHIVDSVNVPIDQFPMDQKYDRSWEVVVVDDTIGNPDTATAVQKLKDENFTNITVLAGGLEQWKNLAGATVSYGDPTSASDQAKVNYMTTDDLNNALSKNTALAIVDVRDPSDYAKAHIKTSVNIPFDQLEKRRFEIKTNSGSAILVGINELQEFEAAVQIHDMLLTKTYAMKGAMDEWTQKNFPTEN